MSKQTNKIRVANERDENRYVPMKWLDEYGVIDSAALSVDMRRKLYTMSLELVWYVSDENGLEYGNLINTDTSRYCRVEVLKGPIVLYQSMDNSKIRVSWDPDNMASWQVCIRYDLWMLCENHPDHPNYWKYA
jgi:hypothetical protein